MIHRVWAVLNSKERESPSDSWGKQNIKSKNTHFLSHSHTEKISQRKPLWTRLIATHCPLLCHHEILMGTRFVFFLPTFLLLCFWSNKNYNCSRVNTKCRFHQLLCLPRKTCNNRPVHLLLKIRDKNRSWKSGKNFRPQPITSFITLNNWNYYYWLIARLVIII